MTDIDYVRGPWEAVLSTDGMILDSCVELDDGEEANICICRGSAIPVKNGEGERDWPRSYSGEDVIELFEDLEYDEAQIRWVQVQAMTAGLNAAGGAA